MDLNLGGKVAWIVGATGTLGEAIALALAGEGARLALSARSEEALAACAARIKAVVCSRPLAITGLLPVSTWQETQHAAMPDSPESKKTRAFVVRTFKTTACLTGFL